MPSPAGDNLLKQLGINDPNSPGNALLELVKGWSNWRAKQLDAPAEDQIGMSAPGGGIGAILRNAAGQAKKFYHGTRKTFDEFDPSKANPDALFGPGLYHTSSPEIASGYAPMQIANPVGLARLEKELAAARARGPSGAQQVKDLQRDMEHMMELLGAPQVRPAYLDIKKPFDLDAAPSPATIRAAVAKGGIEDAAHPDAPAWFPNGEAVYNYLHEAARMDKPAVNEFLQSLGFDGITHVGGARTGNAAHDVGIAFNPEQVLSPWRLPE